MDNKNEKEGSSILTKFLEAVFNTEGHYLTKPPSHEGSTEKPFPEQPTIRPLTETTTDGRNQLFKKWFNKLRAYPEPNSERITARPTTRPLTETTTLSPFHKWWRNWFKEKSGYIPNYERTTTRPLWPGAVYYERTTRKPYVKPFYVRTTERTKIERPLIIQSGSSFGLENCLWVALGGVGVLILMAIFMKLGQPIRRVRRQLSNNRPAPDTISVNQNPYDGNFDMGSLLRLRDTAASTEPAPSYDPPPPYRECLGSSASISKYDSEEPPPRYSAIFENFKHVEPQVHIQLQNDDFVQND